MTRLTAEDTRHLWVNAHLALTRHNALTDGSSIREINDAAEAVREARRRVLALGRGLGVDGVRLWESVGDAGSAAWADAIERAGLEPEQEQERGTIALLESAYARLVKQSDAEPIVTKTRLASLLGIAPKTLRDWGLAVRKGCPELSATLPDKDKHKGHKVPLKKAATALRDAGFIS
jgi:hypothetical protein